MHQYLKLFIIVIGLIYITSKSKVVDQQILATQQQTLILQNNNFRLEFADRKGFPLSYLGSPNKKTNLIKNSDSKIPLWEFQLINKGGIAKVDSFMGKQSFNKVDNNNLQLKWDNVNVVGNVKQEISVQLNVNLDNEAKTASINLQIKNTGSDTQIGLWELQVNIAGFTSSDKDYLLYPFSFGVQYPMKVFKTTGGDDNRYPSGGASFQFFAIGGSENYGGYVGTHDKLGNTKDFVSKYDLLSLSTRLSIKWVPENAFIQLKSFENSFPINIGAFPLREDHSDQLWYDGAQIYKEWVLKNAIWTQKGTLRQRKQEFPDWHVNNSLWINSGWQCYDIFNDTQGDPKTVLERVTNIRNRLGVNMSLHWYEFQQGPDSKPEARYKFDTHYPDYFSTRDGFQDVTLKLHDIGVNVFPYVNGRIFDIKSNSYLNEDGAKQCVKLAKPIFGDNNLTLPQEQYGSDAIFNVADPSQAYWQNKYAEVIYNLTLLNVTGVYIDQLGAAAPQYDFDPNHNHPIGGGSWWVKGVNQMLDAIQSKIENKTYLLPMITESNSEYSIGPLQGLLTLTAFFEPYSGQQTNRVQVPAFPAIYGGYYLGMGSIFNQGDFLQHDIVCAKVAQQFVYGVQLGWFSLTGTNPGFDKDCGAMGVYDYFMSSEYDFLVDFIRLLAEGRRYYVEFFAYGNLVNPGKLLPEPDNFIYDPKFGPSNMRGPYPNATSSVWINENKDKLAIFIVSSTKQGYSGQYWIDLQEYTLEMVEDIKVVSFDNQYQKVLSEPKNLKMKNLKNKRSSSQIAFDINLNDRTLAIYEISLKK